MALPIIALGLGGLIQQTAQAMAQPVDTQQASFFTGPINLAAANGAAHPATGALPSHQLGTLTEPSYQGPADPVARLNGMSIALANMQTAFQKKNVALFANAGDTIVMPYAGSLAPILTSDHEIYTAAYVSQKNLGTRNAAGQLVQGAPIPGTVMGDANWRQ
jgi:hypothetical protein